jgi:hypothetical protein
VPGCRPPRLLYVRYDAPVRSSHLSMRHGTGHRHTTNDTAGRGTGFCDSLIVIIITSLNQSSNGNVIISTVSCVTTIYSPSLLLPCAPWCIGAMQNRRHAKFAPPVDHHRTVLLRNLTLLATLRPRIAARARTRQALIALKVSWSQNRSLALCGRVRLPSYCNKMFPHAPLRTAFLWQL